MKSNRLLLTVLCVIFVVCLGVGFMWNKSEASDKKYVETNDFSVQEVLKVSSSHYYYLLTDENTGVQYIMVHVGQGTAMYPRLDADGFIFYPGYEEEETY